MSRPRTIRQSIVKMGGDARPEADYWAPRTYVVRNGRTDGKLDLDPPADAPHLKTLAGVPVWSLAGSAVRALPGDRVVVVFRDADPTRPTVIAFEPLTTGRHPVVAVDATSLHLGGTLTSTDPAVARVGDTSGQLLFDAVAFTLYYAPSAAAPYAAVVSVNPATPSPPPPGTPGTPIVIATGSGKVTSG